MKSTVSQPLSEFYSSLNSESENTTDQYKEKEHITTPTWTTYHVSSSRKFPNNNSSKSFPLVIGKPQKFRSADSNHVAYETDNSSSWTHNSSSYSPSNVSDTIVPRRTPANSFNSTANIFVPTAAPNLSTNLEPNESQDAKPKDLHHYRMVGPLTFIDFSKPSNKTQEFDEQQGVTVDIVIRDSSIGLVIIQCLFKAFF